MQPLIALNRKKPIVSYVLIGINVAVFLLGMLMERFVGIDYLFSFGAKENTLIAVYNEYWRLVTSTFLHSGIGHLFSNCLGLYIWGPQIEGLLGRMRYLIVYFVAGLFGSLLSFLCSPSVSIGASGAIFGIFGAMLYFRSRHKQVFTAVFGAQVLFIIGFNLVMGFIGTNIDNFGHIGGLIGGFLACFATGLYGEKWTWKHLLMTVLLAALFFVSLNAGVRHFRMYNSPIFYLGW